MADAASQAGPAAVPTSSNDPSPPSEQAATKAPRASVQRLLSIDALRGFDMFWIIGGDALAISLLKLSSSRWASSMREQFEHAEWEGFRFYDLIFPMFLFLVGCVLPFSLDKVRDNPKSAYLRIVRRTCALVLLGLICNGLLQFNWSQLRVAGVLQRIGICYGVAALLCLHLRARGQTVALISILLSYWAILAFVAAPEGAAGDYSKEGNLAGYIDRTFLPGRILKPYYGFGDNEGLLSTFPAIATALLGVLAGEWLKSSARPWSKAAGLVFAGVLSVGLGHLWGLSFPIIKNLWTSSFVLVAGGYSLCLLGLFYTLIDVVGWRRWAFFWVVIGANAITIYVGQRFIDFPKMAQFFLGGIIRILKEQDAAQWATVVLWLGILTAQWLFLLFLYRKKVFLRV